MARPGADEIQLDLFGDYRGNVARYPAFQQYFRTLADVRFFDTGHFALETHCGEIAKAIGDFLDATKSKVP